MAEEKSVEKSGRVKESPVDRLSQCSNKAFALTFIGGGDIGRSERGMLGIEFILLDLANELEDISRELNAKGIF